MLVLVLAVLLLIASSALIALIAATRSGRLRGRSVGGITSRRDELEAILNGMAEGVIVTDDNRRIRSINRAAGALFRIDPGQSAGKSIIEALRNVEIDQLVERVLQSGEALEANIVIYDREIQHVHAHATTLSGAGAARVMLVLNDITRMKRLESIRRDFVANVSHELRTPVTSILGFVETLRDGALNEPESASRFIDIIHSHSLRLNLIIEDLLSLSRLESYDAEIPVERCEIDRIVAAAISACEHDALHKSIEVCTRCSGDRIAYANPTLLEQALVNLINNAIKYSDAGSTVEIETEHAAGCLLLRIRDHGSGIPRRELGRVFERFYRVDRARSRDMGGTGLGLAIVKHIALAHNGEVTVESVESRGSTFTLSIPQRRRGVPPPSADAT